MYEMGLSTAEPTTEYLESLEGKLALEAPEIKQPETAWSRVVQGIATHVAFGVAGLGIGYLVWGRKKT